VLALGHASTSLAIRRPLVTLALPSFPWFWMGITMIWNTYAATIPQCVVVGVTVSGNRAIGIDHFVDNPYILVVVGI
jgi:hypothetical protein